MYSIQRLLDLTQSIQIKYSGLSKITGENFNVFRLLGMGYDEVRTHTMFIAELLNPQGSHDQGYRFLQLFVDQFQIKDLHAASAIVRPELYIGPVTATSGGRIDISIVDKDHNRVIIENKVYAGDQENQLLRYLNYGKSGKSCRLFYLTLEGNLPSEWSGAGLIADTDFETISYRHDILLWIEKCRKEAIDLPVIRETLTQYLHLIKFLTNQTIHHTMQEEIKLKVLHDKDSLDAYFSLLGAYDTIQNEIIEKLHVGIQSIATKFNLELDFYINQYESNTGFSFHSERLAKQNVQIRFELERKGHKSFFFGFCYLNSGLKEQVPGTILSKFAEVFGEKHGTAAWPAWAWVHEYRNWEETGVYSKIYAGELTKLVEEKVQKMLSILE
jgi:hypothetical protein